MRVIKAADTSNVLPLFPERYIEPAEALLIDQLAEINRRQLEANRLRRRRLVQWGVGFTACLVFAVFVGWWLAS